jgi:hypothetical protein
VASSSPASPELPLLEPELLPLEPEALPLLPDAELEPLPPLELDVVASPPPPLPPPELELLEPPSSPEVSGSDQEAAVEQCRAEPAIAPRISEGNLRLIRASAAFVALVGARTLVAGREAVDPCA